jgi:hypothetical protein
MLPPDEVDDDPEMYELFGFRRPALDIRRERVARTLLEIEPLQSKTKPE